LCGLLGPLLTVVNLPLDVLPIRHGLHGIDKVHLDQVSTNVVDRELSARPVGPLTDKSVLVVCPPEGFGIQRLLEDAESGYVSVPLGPQCGPGDVPGLVIQLDYVPVLIRADSAWNVVRAPLPVGAWVEVSTPLNAERQPLIVVQLVRWGPPQLFEQLRPAWVVPLVHCPMDPLLHRAPPGTVKASPHRASGGGRGVIVDGCRRRSGSFRRPYPLVRGFAWVGGPLALPFGDASGGQERRRTRVTRLLFRWLESRKVPVVRGWRGIRKSENPF